MAFNKKPAASKKIEVSKAPVSTPVRNTPIPKVAAAAPAKKAITHADIAKRAYEIWASGKGGSERENWLRAERELRSV